MVKEEHNRTHWGEDSLYKFLNQKLIGKNLCTTAQQITQQCETCLKLTQIQVTRYNYEVLGRELYQETTG